MFRKRLVTVCEGPTYFPYQYWLERGVNYMAKHERNRKSELQERMLVDYLRNIQFTRVLELGCGFGRITRLLLSHFPNISKYVAIDLSPHQIDNAKQYTKTIQTAAGVQFFVSEIQNFNTEEKYDLVLASEVLLHVLPSEIRSVMERMTSMSSVNVINIDWYVENPPERIASHNFLHQYEEIYRRIPSVDEVHKIPLKKLGLDTKQCIFHATVNRTCN